MDFIKGHIYHVFNRSNNYQLVFHNRENYLYFLSKIKEYINPHAQILAWCLMPTHFHLMIEVVNERVETHETHPMTCVETHPMTSSHRMSFNAPKVHTLNDSIAILLRSYTRAINKRTKNHGSLFQQHTKAVCLTEPKFAPAYFQTHFGMIGNISFPETEYLNVCFNYIHMNPVNDHLVRNLEDWEFSSYCDYYCGRKGKLIKRDIAEKFGLYTDPSNLKLIR